MWSSGTEPARVIEVLTPAGSERWFQEIADLDPNDSDGFAGACHRHGIAFIADSPWTKEIRRRFGLAC